MSDHEKIRIRPLDDRSDYALWRIRVFATIDAKGFSDAINPETMRNAAKDVNRQAGNIIVTTLSDKALRVVRSVIGNRL